ncbi:sugar transferase [Balneola sp. MJW-20]|uniref:sugar transferase n=1 Tax=Gracilimonas aurantiaca TaxID=3234185 RepID=UPI0034651DC8
MIDQLERGLQNDVKKILATTYLRHRERRMYRVISRVLDVIISLIAIVVFFPVMVIVASIVFFSNGNPVIFKQDRLGRYGRKFQIMKFRTMRTDAEIILQEDEDLYQLYVNNDYKLPPDQDPRLVKFGAFLRRSSLDELPQLFSVLKGDMSIVGPRPIVPVELERYEGHEQDFLSVKPGITGLWQVTGRSEIEYPQRKYLDLLYIENQSVFSDLKILFKTIYVVIRKSGAH